MKLKLNYFTDKRKNKIEYFPEQQDDPEFDEFFRKELAKDADDFEMEINEDPDLADIDAPDDMFDKIVMELKEKGIWEEDQDDGGENDSASEIPLDELYKMLPEKEREALEIGKKVQQRSKWYSMTRVASVVAIVALCVFGVSMTSEANREYVLGVFATFTGAEVDVKMQGSDNSYEISGGEEKARREIEKKIGIEVPDMLYRPDKMEYIRYKVDEVIGIAHIFYFCGEDAFTLSIYESKADSVGADTYAGEIVTSIFNENIQLNIEMYEVGDNERELMYSGQFLCGKVHYGFVSELSMEETGKILEKIHINID